MARVKALNIIEKEEKCKRQIDKGFFKVDHGLMEDAHAGNSKRQVSLFAAESIAKIKNLQTQGFCTVKFAENITTEGIALHELHLGAKLKVGEVTLEITQIGKQCYLGCKIRELSEDCVMPKEVVFAKVITEGWIAQGDEIQVVIT